MEAIVLAGGLGTRLKTVVSDVPKPMAPVAGKPFLSYILNWLHQNGITRVILSVGYKWETIHNVYGVEYRSMKLSYSVERSPLGTGGAIALGMEKVEEDEVFIINGDTFFNINLKEFREFHIKQNRKISLALKPMVNFDRYGKVELDNTNRIIKFFEKQSTSKGLINAGIYFADKNLTRLFPRTKKFSFEKDFLEMKLDKLNVGGYVADKYFIDIGIPDDFNRAQTELLSF